MRAFFILTLILVTAWPVFGETLDLGASGRLTYEIPAGWHLKGSKAASLGQILELRPQSDLNAACQVMVTVTSEPMMVSDQQLITGFEEEIRGMLDIAVEKEVKLKELPIKGGFGVYSTITDRSLVGKPSEPDNFKVLISVMIKMSNTLLVTVSIYTDDKDNKEVESLLKMLKEMKLDATL